MCRIQVWSVITISLIIASSASPTPPLEGKDTSILGLEGAEDEITNLEPSYLTKRTGELGSVLGAIKSQFREIIEDLLWQAFEYFKINLQQFKVNLLRKLGMYTLSDVFHTIFDGVNDFVAIGSAPEPADEEYSDDKTPVVLTPDFNSYNDAYSLAALLASKRTVS